MAGECNYGGRVTDANDRRTLLTILEDFYNPTIIQDYKNENDKNEQNNYQFSVLSNQYSIPQMGWLQNHRDYIKEELPMMDDGPEMYGLHSNANISCALQETTALLETALSLQPQDSGNSGGDGASSWDEQVSTLASAIEKRVPSNFLYDVPLVALKYPVAYEESMNTVLQQELLRFNGLLKIVHFTLIELQKAIKGLVLLSSDLEQMGYSMIEGAVPEAWTAVSYPSLKPLGGWVNDLIQRLEFFNLWITNGSPSIFWLPGFFFTQSFITGTRQNHARRSSIPIDEIGYDFQVLTSTVKRNVWVGPTAGCYVHGLFLQGAAWDTTSQNRMADEHYGQGTSEIGTGGTGSLVESTPKELFVSMPVIWFWPRRLSDIPIPMQDLGGTAHVYVCPVYKTSARRGMLSTTGHSTNFVIAVRLPVNNVQDHRHWIKRGVAMLTATD